MSEMKRRQGGFSYLFLLFLVALLGVTLVASTQASWIESKRDKEAELLFAGHEIRKAIDSYYKAIPTRPGAGAQALAQISRADARQDSMQPAENSGVVLPKGEYPRQIEDLLEDRRFTPPLRHLRRQYVEPVTGSMEWGLVQEGGRGRDVVGQQRRGGRGQHRQPAAHGIKPRCPHCCRANHMPVGA